MEAYLLKIYILSLALTDLVENRHLMRRWTCGQSKVTYDECKNQFFFCQMTFFILCLILYLDKFLRPPMFLEFLLLEHYCAWKNSNQPDLAKWTPTMASTLNTYGITIANSSIIYHFSLIDIVDIVEHTSYLYRILESSQ